jgi:hypothetical protein
MKAAVLALGMLLAATAARADANADARALLAARHLDGAVVVRDVTSGGILVDASTGTGWEAGVLPLSTVKLLLVLEALDHHRDSMIDIPDLVVEGYDDDGRTLALELRRGLGSETVLGDFARYGLPRCAAGKTLDCTTLAPATADGDWASALSIGERFFRVSPAHLSGMLAAIGKRRDAQAHALETAMRDCVDSGTAKAVAHRIARGFALGGKTGSGPAGVEPSDGIFAALVFDAKGAARYAVVAYVRKGGHGGGAAAELAADAANLVIRSHP